MNPPSVHKVPRIKPYTCIAALILTSLATETFASDVNEFVLINGSAGFHSVLQSGDAQLEIKSFQMQAHPVTNAEYLQFVIAHAEWQRGKVASIFANAEYLDHWQAATELGDNVQPSQPVTRISWFAAQAYCESIQSRLPAWYEWELAAAASESMHDARNDAEWRQHILDWYAKPVGNSLSAVMQSKSNIYNLYDMHGLIWEWVLDFNALMDSNEAQKFCGSGALNLQQKENFAILMHVAMFTSLHATDTLHTMGFRCVRDVAHE